MSTDKIEEKKVVFPEEDFILSIRFLFGEWDTINILRMYHHEENEEVDDLLDDLLENLIKWVLDQDVSAKDIEDYVTDVITEDIGVEVEDPSVGEFATEVLKIYSSLEKTGKHPIVEVAKQKMKKLEEKQKKMKEDRKKYEQSSEKKKKEQEEEIDGKDLKDEDIVSDEEEEEEEEKMKEDDEWETVTHKHKKNYKKNFKHDLMDEE
eukprot:gene2785-4193_t